MRDDSGTAFDHKAEDGRLRNQKHAQSLIHLSGDFQDGEKIAISHHSFRNERRYRVRRVLWIFQMLAFLCLGLCIPYVAKWGYERIAYRNDNFRLTKLRIETLGIVSKSFIAETAGVTFGDNLADVDPKVIEAKLIELPEVESAEVARHFPDCLKIQVKERIAKAWLSCPDHKIRPLRNGGFLVDRNGIVFPCRKMAENFASLPTIEIRGISRPVEGSVVSSFLLFESLKLINASRLVFSERRMEITDLRTLGTWGLMCRYPNDLLVTFDINRIEEGLLDLDEIIKKTEKSNLSLATVNLVTVKNIPVTFHSEDDRVKW